MRVSVFAVALFLALQSLPVSAADAPPFHLLYRQENVSVDRYHSKSDLWVTVINLSGAEARDVTVSLPVLNPYLFIDSPVLVGTLPDRRQAEVLHPSSMPRDVVALAEPEESLVWRIEYTGEGGERGSVDVRGVRGN